MKTGVFSWVGVRVMVWMQKWMMKMEEPAGMEASGLWQSHTLDALERSADYFDCMMSSCYR